jgi:hypothetical protein
VETFCDLIVSHKLTDEKRRRRRMYVM